MLLEQVLFDNGRRKAERAFAAADVEVAAVTLSADMNDRVKSALSLYVSGLRGDEKAAYAHRAIRTMRDFERVVVERVNGGVSDRPISMWCSPKSVAIEHGHRQRCAPHCARAGGDDRTEFFRVTAAS